MARRGMRKSATATLVESFVPRGVAASFLPSSAGREARVRMLRASLAALQRDAAIVGFVLRFRLPWTVAEWVLSLTSRLGRLLGGSRRPLVFTGCI